MVSLRIYRNLPLGGKDELVGVSIKRNSTPAISHIFIPVFAQALALAPTSASISGPPGRYTDKNLQRTTKLTLKSFVKGQEYGQANSVPWDIAFKDWNPDFYYRSLHMECYYFC